VVWVGQALAGLGAAALFPTTLAMLAAGTHTTRNRSWSIALWAGFLSAGGLLAPVLVSRHRLHDEHSARSDSAPEHAADIGAVPAPAGVRIRAHSAHVVVAGTGQSAVVARHGIRRDGRRSAVGGGAAGCRHHADRAGCPDRAGRRRFRARRDLHRGRGRQYRPDPLRRHGQRRDEPAAGLRVHARARDHRHGRSARRAAASARTSGLPGCPRRSRRQLSRWLRRAVLSP
jgi:hypothetical protein